MNLMAYKLTRFKLIVVSGYVVNLLAMLLVGFKVLQFICIERGRRISWFENFFIFFY